MSELFGKPEGDKMLIHCPRCHSQLDARTLTLRMVGQENGMDLLNGTCPLCCHEFSLKQARETERVRELPWLGKHLREAM